MHTTNHNDFKGEIPVDENFGIMNTIVLYRTSVEAVVYRALSNQGVLRARASHGRQQEGKTVVVKHDFIIQTEEGKVRDLLGKNSARILGNDRNRAAFEQAKQDLMDLSEPVVVWKSFVIKEFVHDRLILDDHTRIGGGPVVQVTGGAERLILAICTIGHKVELKVKHYMEDGERMQGIFLDTMASWAVDHIRRRFGEWIRNEFKCQNGFRTSAMLSPGESEWDVREQALIFDLLRKEAEEEGMHLTESGLIVPIKSISLLMGVGPNPLGIEDAENCDFCSQRETCRYRHMVA